MHRLLMLCCVLLIALPNAAQETPTPTPPPIDTLTSREPALDEVDAYLRYHLQTVENWNSFTFLNTDSLTYADLNGDGQDDLIVEGYLQIAVMTWLGDRYGEPLLVQGRLSTRNPSSRFRLEDWTDDGVPEVVFDTRSAYSGTGILGETWVRHILHCAESACRVVWQVEIADYFSVAWGAHGGGLSLARADVTRTQSDDGVPTLETESFDMYVNWSDASQVGGYRLYDVENYTHSRYVWDGETFALVASEDLPAPDISTEGIFLAENSDGLIAEIEVDSYEDEIEPNIIYTSCTLNVAGDRVTFELCTPQFTRLSWQDLTADGSEELVFQVLYGLGGVPRCMYQRIVAFQVNENGDLDEIANVTGCVRDVDLFGVAVTQFDDDPALEILSAGERTNYEDDPECRGLFCWYELNRDTLVYKWDGESYTLAETISGAESE